VAVVVDDHALLNLLTDAHRGWLRSEVAHSAIYTTAAWYYRVASAAHRGTGDGQLSRRLVALESETRLDTLAKIDQLPEWVGLIGPRALIPVMATLDVRRRPNGLTAEALALALVTESTLAVSVDAPLLRDGADDLGIEYRLL
jgi:hypothetical protein